MSSYTATLVIGKSLYQGELGLRSEVGEIQHLRQLFPDMQVLYENELEVRQAELLFVDSALVPGFVSEPYTKVMLRYNKTEETRTSSSTSRAEETCASKRASAKFIHCPDQLPRCLLSQTNESLDISTTQIIITDSITASTLNQISRWKQKFTPCKTVSVCVIDMDDVLIDNENKLYKGAAHFIQNVNAIFDKTVLWSHGSSLHVDEYSNDILREGGKFDLILSRQHKCSSKNLLHLYNIFSNEQIKFAVLIDDTPYNYTDEYNLLIVPKREKMPNYPYIISLLRKYMPFSTLTI